MDLHKIRDFHHLNQLALVVIDAQKNFARDPLRAREIVNTKNTLSSMGILTYLLYMDGLQQGHAKACGGLLDGLNQGASTNEPPVAKSFSDSLVGTGLSDELHHRDIKGVLIAGYSNCWL